MSDSSPSSSLYNDAIMEKAKASRKKARLPHPDSSASLDNPLCGDRATIDIAMTGDHLQSLGHEIKGCLLCEAAAMAIDEAFLGKNRSEIVDGIEAISRLIEAGASPPSRWQGFSVFAPIHSARSRRTCVLLPFRALRQALDKI